MPEFGSGYDAGRDARIAQQNKDRVAKLDARDRSSEEEARMAREGNERLKQEQAAMRDKFAQREAIDMRVVAPQIDTAREQAFAIAKPAKIDRGFPAPQAESGGVERPMEKIVDDSDDWVKKAKESVPNPQITKPAPKKGFFARLFS